MTQPTDGKNQEVTSKLRYVVSSGDMDAIHGMSNYQVMTQEAQVFGFYADTGQGKGGQGGPGTGKHVLNTPGLSMEVLGKGLKVRDNGDITQLPAKIIKCKRGDVIIDCENGDITLRIDDSPLMKELLLEAFDTEGQTNMPKGTTIIGDSEIFSEQQKLEAKIRFPFTVPDFTAIKIVLWGAGTYPRTN